MTRQLAKGEILTTQEKKEHLCRIYGLEISKLRYFGTYKGTGMLWDYLTDGTESSGWKAGTKFYVMQNGKAGIQ